VPFVNFEDEQLAGLRADELPVLIEEYYRRYPAFRQQETVVFCLDEIQVVPGWERFVRRLIDSEKVQVFITGSSASLLSREIATALRGRAWALTLSIFSQGFNVIVRVMMFFSHAVLLVGDQRNPDIAWIITALLAIGMSTWFLLRLDRTDVRMLVTT
jgi:hypothetical protein